MDRIVALKVLSAAAMTSPEAIRRFQREVRAAARLAHPNIVLAFDAGATADQAASPLRLRERAIVWNNELLPDLVTSRGSGVPSVVTRIGEKLLQLPAAGVEVFRFKDLDAALEEDARRRDFTMNAIYAQPDGTVKPPIAPAPSSSHPPAQWRTRLRRPHPCCHTAPWPCCRGSAPWASRTSRRTRD